MIELVLFPDSDVTVIVLLLTANPIVKRVAVLINMGFPPLNPLVIVEYVDEVWKERAMARFWSKFAEEKVRMTDLESPT
ncbi:hypothetical protein ACLOJK_025431 [Asimina triloba]